MKFIEKKNNKKKHLIIISVLFSLTFVLVAPVINRLDSNLKHVSYSEKGVELQKYFSSKNMNIQVNPTRTAYAEIADNVDEPLPVEQSKEIYGIPDVQNILVVGSDSRSTGDIGRSDVLMVMQIDKEDKKVRLVSIPRDTRVVIADEGYHDKINHAFGKGIDTTVKTVENFLDTSISGYVQFDFKSFVNLIDKLGGVNVESKMAFKEKDSNDNPYSVSIKEGTQLLDGEQALAYARMRKQDTEGDIGRGKRQQEVLESVTHQLLNPLSLASTVDMLPELAKDIVTSYTYDQIIEMVNYYGTTAWSFETDHISGEGAMIEGVYYHQPYDKGVSRVKNFLRGEEDGADSE